MSPSPPTKTDASRSRAPLRRRWLQWRRLQLLITKARRPAGETKTSRMRSTGAKVGIAGAATAPSPAGSLQRARRRRRWRQVPFPHGWTSGWAEVARPFWGAAAAAWILRGPRTMAAASSTAYSPWTMSRYGGAPVLGIPGSMFFLGLPDPDPFVRVTDRIRILPFSHYNACKIPTSYILTQIFSKKFNF
jgi:hypothetical protein